MLTANPILETAETYLRETVSPRAQAIDQDPDALREALKGLCDLKLMALRRPTAYGGPDIGEEPFREFQECVARYSGALAFLQTQHQSAVSLLSKSDNVALKDEYLPHMADGGKFVGIGFSQLRRNGPPMMRAEAVDSGYRLTGKVPWVTGFGFYPEFLIGAALPDGRNLLAIVPLTNVAGEIEVSEPMKLAAMDTAMTVSVEFRNYLVADARVVYLKPPDWIKHNDQINIALQSHFAIGCIQAGLDVLARAVEAKKQPFLDEAMAAFEAEFDECKRATDTARGLTGEDTAETRLQTRAWAIELAVRTAHAGVAAWSGAANSLNHPAQRVYREALVYTVSAQTLPVMEATLKRLAARP